MPAPTYTIEVAWSGAVVGRFTLGVSALGGTDTLGGTFGGGAFDALSDVMTLSIVRGRDAVDAPLAAGELTLVLSDPNGRYAPENVASPLYGRLKPLRPLRVRATYGGSSYALFSGYISSIEADPRAKTASIRAVDLFLWLARARPVIPATGMTTTGAAIGRVLDAVRWTEPAMRRIDTGDAIPNFSADGSVSALDLVTALLVPAGGVFFVAGDGAAVYLDRYAQYRAPRDVAQSTLEDAGAVLTPSVTLDTVRNRVTVTRTGGVPQSYTDTASVAGYGYADLAPLTTPYLTDDIQASRLARYTVSQRKDLLPAPRRLGLVNRDAATLTAMLARDVEDHVSVQQAAGYTADDFTVVGVQHEVSAGGTKLATTWTLRKRPASAPFRIGRSMLGSTHILVY